jgi:enoyl-CoA hydratase
MRNDYSYYEVEVRDGLATIRFRHRVVDDSPAGHAAETTLLVKDIADDGEVNVAVLIGTGERFGPSKSEGAPKSVGGPEDRLAAYAAGRSFVHALVDLDKPVVAALNGDALLIGITIALLSDIVVAERHIYLQDQHVPLGESTATGPLIWPLSTGLLRAKRYLLTGEKIAATEAERIGLVTEVVDRGASEGRALEYGAMLAAMRPEAVRQTKHALNETLRSDLTSKFDVALGLQHLGKPEPTR